MRSHSLVFIILLAAVATLWAGGSREQKQPNGASDEAPVNEAQNGAVSTEVVAQLESIGVQPVSRNLQAADFSLATLQGPPMTLEDYKGSLILLNFWATWCAPCVMEMPSMQNLYDTFRDDGLEVVAVNVQEDRDVVAAFIEEHGLSFPVLLDTNGRTSFDYAVRGLPTSFLIGRKGQLLGIKIGFHLWDEPDVLETIESLLEQGV
jgi:thiol-disulfide isomerase/thioredoxin